MRVKVYFASKLQHAALWREYEKFSPREIVSVTRWPSWIKPNETKGFENDPLRARQGWIIDEEDVREADVVIVYAGPDGADVLRGTLVEAGMAIALGKPVVVVGVSESYGTWKHHPLVHQADTLVQACGLAISLTLAPVDHGVFP